MDARSLVLTVILIISATSDRVEAGSYRYLGCHKDRNGVARDLKGVDLILTDLSPVVCAGQCQSLGYPYFGLQFGKRCFCGDSYGSYGASVDCNTTCDHHYCGGYMSNDVYYSPDKSVAAQRRHLFHPSAATFSDARRRCVANDGDLPTIENSADLEDVISNITSGEVSEGNSTRKVEAVWVGLRQRLTSGPLEWTNENTIPYNMHYHDFVNFWEPTEMFLQPCTKMIVATKKWESVSCDVTLPFVCLQIPPVPEVTEPSVTEAEPLTEEENSTMNLAMLIVIPIFIACYGSSCIAYIVYKIYRNCFRVNGKSHAVNLETVESQAAAAAAARAPPPAFPAYLHAAPQRLPPSVNGGPSGYGKSVPRYEPKADVAAKAGTPEQAESDAVPIAEILMKKMAAKPSGTSY